MEINYQYKMTISNKAEAVDAIMHMCDNCDNFFLCTGAMSSKCNEVKEKIKEEFTKSECQKGKTI